MSVEKPPSCPDDVWERLTPGEQRSAPKNDHMIWSEWLDFRRLANLVDLACDGVKTFNGKQIRRLTLMPREGRELASLAIADARSSGKEFAAFFRGAGAFGSMARLLGKIAAGSAEWKLRQARETKEVVEDDETFQSGAF